MSFFSNQKKPVGHRVFDVDKLEILLSEGPFKKRISERGVGILKEFFIEVRNRNEAGSADIKWIVVDVVASASRTVSEKEYSREIEEGNSKIYEVKFLKQTTHMRKKTCRLDKTLDQGNILRLSNGFFAWRIEDIDEITNDYTGLSVYQLYGELSDGTKFHKLFGKPIAFDANGEHTEITFPKDSNVRARFVGGAVVALAISLIGYNIWDGYVSANRAEEEATEARWHGVKDRKAFVIGQRVRLSRDVSATAGDDEKSPARFLLPKGTEGIVKRADSNGKIWISTLGKGAVVETVYVLEASALEIVEKTKTPDQEPKELKPKGAVSQGKIYGWQRQNQRSRIGDPIRPGGLAAGGGGVRGGQEQQPRATPRTYLRLKPDGERGEWRLYPPISTTTGVWSEGTPCLRGGFLRDGCVRLVFVLFLSQMLGGFL